MIARVEAPGLRPLQVAEKFALFSYDEPRKVDISTFYAEFPWFGLVGNFKLVDGVETIGMRWFKRRGGVYAFYRINAITFGLGKRDAARGRPLDDFGDTLADRVSFLDGYLAGIPRKLKGTPRYTLETDALARIESLLYDGG